MRKLKKWRKRQKRTIALTVMTGLLLILVAVATFVYTQNGHVGAQVIIAPPVVPSYAQGDISSIYYTLKQPSGFVLARSHKGAYGQPLDVPQVLAQFNDGFGLAESDSVLSMQLSPDGRYLAIDGSRDHGEQVWIFDTQRATLCLTPDAVVGNFLHWLPGTSTTGHSFLYRPLLPLGPSAPMDGNGWNPGLWIVDAATGTITNIDIALPSAYLVDAAPSPDGSQIVYSTSLGLEMGSDTWLMNSDGNRRTHLFSTAGGAQSIPGLFAWSPDGKSIAYEQLSDGPTPFVPAGLWLMNSSGGQQRRLAETDGGHGYMPVWSPDSSKIAYIVRTNAKERSADINAQALQSAIAVVDIKSGRSQLVASAAQTKMQINANPAWSADSTSLTFAAFNPINCVVGGTPHYWLASGLNSVFRTQAASIPSQQGQSLSLQPLSATIEHVVALE